MSVRKQFSRALYEAYDTPARDKLVAYLESKGHTIVNNEENYSVDVVSQKGGYTTSMRLRLRQHGKLTGLHTGLRYESQNVSNGC